MFIKEVGWGEKYKRYKNITYKISAPYGHLPFRVTSHVWNFGPPYIGKNWKNVTFDKRFIILPCFL